MKTKYQTRKEFFDQMKQELLQMLAFAVVAFLAWLFIGMIFYQSYSAYMHAIHNLIRP